MDEIHFLQSQSLFGGLTNTELNRILPFLKEVKFKKDEFILKEGEINDKLYLIYKGSVEISKHYSKKKQHHDKQIIVLHTGDTFGEMEVIDIQPCIASVKTIEPTTILTLSSRDLHQISKENLKTFTLIIMNLAREISRRLRRMDELAAASI
ncbi:MAG: cyclic nucleotide-binding domain-containing protein [Spirochaetales bacterium]|nr:cyclic nucleotide-binding domain-containing protein [Spirochaetales bacterium]RKX82387.1 MAG: cyclic nucleotide-binding domain-containing protein [Spirochaetota bacterium]